MSDVLVEAPRLKSLATRRLTNGSEVLKFRNGSEFRPHPPSEDSLHSKQSDSNSIDEAWAFSELRARSYSARSSPPPAHGECWSTSNRTVDHEHRGDRRIPRSSTRSWTPRARVTPGPERPSSTSGSTPTKTPKISTPSPAVIPASANSSTGPRSRQPATNSRTHRASSPAPTATVAPERQSASFPRPHGATPHGWTTCRKVASCSAQRSA